MENLIGRTFNFLTVIEGPIRKDTTKKIFWKCKCQCGKEKIVRGDQLKAGTTKSCGCFKKQLFVERNIKRQTLDLTKMRFGKLVALEKTNERKNGRIIWKCKCDCGAIVFCDTHSLQQGNTQSCGCLRSKGEEKIRQILKENNIPFEEQKTFETCKFDDSGYLAKFDFYINNKYIIEYDGEQHFYYKVGVNTWNNEENYKIVKSHDEIKNNWCKENNIPIIRIPYYDLNKITIKDLLEDSEYII